MAIEIPQNVDSIVWRKSHVWQEEVRDRSFLYPAGISRYFSYAKCRKKDYGRKFIWFFKERETVLKYDFNGGVRLPEFVLQT